MKNYLAILGLALVFLFGGCSDDDDEPIQPSGNGTLRVAMVDAPADYDSVNIVVDSVLVHVAGGDTMSGWITLNTTRATYNLLELVNGVEAVIGSASLPAGRYSQLRLYIGEGSTVVVDSVSHPLTIPSGQQSGLKINIDATIVPDITYLITLDFDAHRSILETGNPNNRRYQLKPVIRAHAAGVTGSITAKLIPAMRGVVTAIGVNDTLTTSADTTGGFRLRFVPAGIYTVAIVPLDTLYRDTTISNVTVVPANDTDLGGITLPLR